jgi:hypothetical protein
MEHRIAEKADFTTSKGDRSEEKWRPRGGETSPIGRKYPCELPCTLPAEDFFTREIRELQFNVRVSVGATGY